MVGMPAHTWEIISHGHVATLCGSGIVRPGHASVIAGLIKPDNSIDSSVHELLVRSAMSVDSSLAWRCEFRIDSDTFWPLQSTDTRRPLSQRYELAAKWSALPYHCREQYGSLPMARVVATLGPDARPDGRVTAETVLDQPFQKMAYRAAATLDCQNADMELLNSRNARDHEEGDGHHLTFLDRMYQPRLRPFRFCSSKSTEVVFGPGSRVGLALSCEATAPRR